MSSLPVHNPRFDVPLRDPAWHQRMFWIVFSIVLVWPLAVATEFRPGVLFEPENMRISAEFIGSFFPPVLEPDLLWRIVGATWTTVAIATAGMVMALTIAFPLTILSTRVLSISAISGRMNTLPFVVRQAIRWVLIFLRSIPELVWALVFVRVEGLGPTAGVLAIALTYGGMLGKVYGEILESGETTPTETLLRNGSGRMQAFFYGLLPQNVMELTSYTVYRWECAIRSSVVLGFVGAGGLGQELDNSMKMFNGGEVSTMLIVFILLVALADAVSAFFRKRLV